MLVSTDQWIAVGGLTVGFVGLLVGGAGALMKVSFKLGGHAERLTKLESAVQEAEKGRIDAQRHVTDLAVITQIVGDMKVDVSGFMDEIRRWKERVDSDIRNHLSNKSAARRVNQ